MVTLALLLAACHAPDGHRADDSSPGMPACVEGEVADGEVCVPAACGVGPWGGLGTDDTTVFVDAAGGESGDGSELAPFRSIQAGVDLAGSRGGGTVAVAAGAYVETVSMGDDHKDVVVAGRCRELVTIDGSGGDDVPTVGVMGDRKRPAVTLLGLTLTGGTYGGLWVQHAVVSMSTSDLRENAVAGLVAPDAEITLDDVGIYDTRPDSHGDYGRGIDMASGTRLTATGCTLQRNLEWGVLAQGVGTAVELVDTSVLDTGPNGDRELGRGVEVDDGAALRMTGCTLQRNTDTGVSAADARTTVDLVDTTVLDTSPTPRGTFGRGIEVESGAALTATGCTVQGNTKTGVVAAGEGTTVSLTDTVVLDTSASPDGTGGRGLEVQSGAALVATGCTLQRNTGIGVIAGDAGTTVDLVDTVVLDTAPGPNGDGGRGIDVGSGAALTATRCTVSGNTEIGVLGSDAGTTLDLQDTDVLDTVPTADGGLGMGISVRGGAALHAERCTVQGNADVGVYGSGVDTWVDLIDTRVSDTHPHADGTFGRGLDFQDGAGLTATRCTLDGNSDVGVFGSDAGTTMDLEDTVIQDTSPRPSGAGGRGIEVESGAALTATGCTLDGNTEIGVLTEGPGSAVELVDTAILDTHRGRVVSLALGAAAQHDGYLHASDCEITGTEGPAVYATTGGGAVLEQVDLTASHFAAVVVLDADVDLSATTITGTLPDEEWGGGFGVYANDHFGPATLTLADSTIGPHDYAAVWLDGDGTYEIERNTLEGSAGVEIGGWVLHGNALFVENGVTAWDGATGLRLVDNTFQGAPGIAVLLDGSSALLDGNSWADDGSTLRQQTCGDAVPLNDTAPDWAPEWNVCPAANVMTAYDLVLTTLYLPQAESQEW